MPLQIFNIFFKTAIHGLRLIGKTNEERVQVKLEWAQMVIKNFGFSMTVDGQPPIPGAQIFVGNHISYLDITVLMAAMPQVTFIAKDDLKKWPIIGPCASAAGTIFVNRRSGSSGKLIKDQIINKLNTKNTCIGIFPSGTTTLSEEKPWKKGAFKIAKEAGIPIQLFRIDYNPTRPSAYIDNDTLLLSMAKLLKIKNKSIKLQWLGRYEYIEEPSSFAEELRQKVILSSENNSEHVI
jgi:1-acyl-sn-glycerol-3-phosphate acyltransferase